MNTLRKEDGNKHVFIAFERTLGESLKPFMAEVYHVNPGLLAYYVQARLDGNLGDIVDSSAEGTGRPGLLRYAKEAAVTCEWESELAISLRLEFAHESLTALFDVVFKPDWVGVDILAIAYRERPTGLPDGYARFVRALQDLRRLDS